MVLKLYGSAMSTSRVLVTILEKQLPYELILVDIAKGDQYTEEYKKLQPFGKVPVLDDDGFIMFESRAICKYLARHVFYGGVAFALLLMSCVPGNTLPEQN
jgi:glutathione S-transferase